MNKAPISVTGTAEAGAAEETSRPLNAGRTGCPAIRLSAALILRADRGLR